MTVSIFHKQSPSNREGLRSASGGLLCCVGIFFLKIPNSDGSAERVRYIFYPIALVLQMKVRLVSKVSGACVKTL